MPATVEPLIIEPLFKERGNDGHSNHTSKSEVNTNAPIRQAQSDNITGGLHLDDNINSNTPLLEPGGKLSSGAVEVLKENGIHLTRAERRQLEREMKKRKK